LPTVEKTVLGWYHPKVGGGSLCGIQSRGVEVRYFQIRAKAVKNEYRCED